MRELVKPAPSRLVAQLRWVFPVLFLALLGVLMVWPQLERKFALQQTAAPLLDEQSALQAINENRLTNAVYTDTDSHNRPFEVRASQAQQTKSSSNAIYLTNPSAKLDLGGQKTLTGTAKQGTYQQEKKLLVLSDTVVVERHDETQNVLHFKTQALQVDLTRNTAHTNLPVTVENATTRIEGVGLLVIDGGDTVYIGGPAKAIWRNE